MREIPLTQGKVALVDDADYERLSAFSWCFDGRYAVRGSRGGRKGTRRVYLHREIMMPPAGMVVDHRSGDKLDNQRSNLRVCTRTENIYSQRKFRRATSSRYKGVCWKADRERWRAEVCCDGRRYFLGYFDGEEDAARAYDAKAVELFGEFALLNFPREEAMCAA